MIPVVKVASINRFVGNYRFLSNFYLQPVTYQGVLYKSVEHAYQAAKTLIPAEKTVIALAESCTNAKRLGNKVTLREDWDSIRLQVMEDLLRLKFEDPFLRSRLIGTAPSELIEGNYWGDTYWGVYYGKGENHLGKLLMKIREEMKDKSK